MTALLPTDARKSFVSDVCVRAITEQGELKMKKFDGLLICTDLDGTLLGSDGRVSKENLEAIEYFKDKGGAFTYVTGRLPCCVAGIYDMIKPNVPMGVINGGGIYDYSAGKYLRKKELSSEVMELVELAERNVEGIGIQVNTFETVYFSQENSAMEWFRRVTGMPNVVRHYRAVDEPIAKIVFGDKRVEAIEQLMKLLKTHPLSEKFDFIRSEKALYEILPKGANKGCIIPQLCEIIGISPEKTVAVGDYNNDVSMLRAAHIGIAVANAVPEAKAAADRITVSNDEHALARIIHDIEAGEIFPNT